MVLSILYLFPSDSNSSSTCDSEAPLFMTSSLFLTLHLPHSAQVRASMRADLPCPFLPERQAMLNFLKSSVEVSSP